MKIAGKKCFEVIHESVKENKERKAVLLWETEAII